MKTNKDHINVWREYEKAQLYNDSLGLAKRVETNENFFLGKQWEGVNAPELDKPVFNVLKRVVNYFISMLVTDRVGLSLSLFNRKADGVNRVMLKALEMQVEQVMEMTKFPSAMRQVLRDAAVDGDGCLHVFFDPEAETGWEYEQGLLDLEVMKNTAVFFGNPQNDDVQKQPYLLLESRKTLEAVKDEMKRNRRPKAEIDQIQPDYRYNDTTGEENKVTVVTKYWKEGGRVWHLKCTKQGMIKKPTATPMKLYPICYMSWERVKDSYHGVGVVDGLIPNQIAINKMAALAQRFIRQQAFPRVFYNKAKLDHWKEGIMPLGVTGDPRDVVYSDNHSRDMSSQVSEYFDKFIANTRDLMGASDTALGNVRPENTSAIIAVQKATAVPLELVKQAYYAFVEDFIRIAIDQMRCFYGKRTILATSDTGEQEEIPFDFGVLEHMVLCYRVDVGAASYWSEMTSIETLDNLFEKNLLDPLTYIEGIPAHLIPNKAKIEGDLRKQQEAGKITGLGQPADNEAMTANGGFANQPM